MRMCGRRWCSRLFCCFLLPNCCSLPSIEVIFERLFPVVDFLIRRVLGRFLFVLVYSLLCFILLVVAAIVIPYESLHKPAWVMYILVVFASWITANLFFHYTMACRIKPGSPQKSSQLPQCRTCKNHKPANAHHCSICNICVLNMDHHCIWINQCVGAANHRYFLQFVAFISLGCATFVVAASNTFYYNYWHAFTNNRMFCDSDLLAGRLPWFELVCAHGPTMIMSTIFFSYLLCAIVCLLVGALFYWNFVLISSGETYLGVLIHSVGCLPMLRMALFPCRSAHFRENWRRFLGLKRGGPTFFRHILFPSTHQALGYLNWDGQQPVEEQQKLLAAIV